MIYTRRIEKITLVLTTYMYNFVFKNVELKIINTLKWKDKMYDLIVLPTEREEIKRQGAKLQILPSFISKKSFKKK